MEGVGYYGVQMLPLATLLDNSGRVDVERSNFDRFVLELGSKGL